MRVVHVIGSIGIFNLLSGKTRVKFEDKEKKVETLYSILLMNNESEYTSSVLIVIWLRPSQVKLFQLTFAILVHAR